MKPHIYNRICASLQRQSLISANPVSAVRNAMIVAEQPRIPRMLEASDYEHLTPTRAFNNVYFYCALLCFLKLEGPKKKLLKY